VQEEDLAAVAAVGAPAAGAVAVDGEGAGVDLGVVAFAEQHRVVQRGLPAECPGEAVMDVAPPGRGVAAGEDAAAVAGLDGAA
jgi:hypothetical protein